MNFLGKSADLQYGRRSDGSRSGSGSSRGAGVDEGKEVASPLPSLLTRYRSTTSQIVRTGLGDDAHDDELGDAAHPDPTVTAAAPSQARRRPIAAPRRGVRSPRASLRTIPGRTAGGSSANVDTVSDASESADDEATSGNEEDIAMYSTRSDGWRRADRLYTGTRVSLDDLHREQNIVENDLRSSLSTLLMLRPGSSGSQSLPAFLRNPAHIPSQDPFDTEQALAEVTPTIAALSMSTSPSSVLTALPSDRRRVDTATASSRRHNSPMRPLTPASSAGEWQHVSSVSSFVDLQGEGRADSADELGFDDLEHDTAMLRLHSLRAGQPQTPSAKHSKSVRAGMPVAEFRHSHATLHAQRTSEDRRGTYSEPEIHTTGLHPAADKTFMELLDAARTFAALRAATSTVVSSQLCDRNSQPSLEQSTPASFEIAAQSPHIPASMTASTQFALSSSDSPPSRDLASSLDGDDLRLHPDTPCYRERDTHNARDDDCQTRSPSPATDMRRKKEAALLRANEQANAPPQTTDEKVYNKDPEGRLPHLTPGESWSAWFIRQFRRVTFGVGLLGLSYLFAIGMGIVQRPLIMRKGMNARQNHILLNRISL